MEPMWVPTLLPLTHGSASVRLDYFGILRTLLAEVAEFKAVGREELSTGHSAESL